MRASSLCCRCPFGRPGVGGLVGLSRRPGWCAGMTKVRVGCRSRGEYRPRWGAGPPTWSSGPLRVSCRPCLGTLTRTQDFWDNSQRRGGIHPIPWRCPLLPPLLAIWGTSKHLSKEGQWEGEGRVVSLRSRSRSRGGGRGRWSRDPSFPSHRLRGNRGTHCLLFCSSPHKQLLAEGPGLPEEAA